MKALFVLFLLSIGIQLSAQETIPEDVNALLTKNMCNACHKLDAKLIGPSYLDLASKGHSVKEIEELIKEPKQENWPDYPPMAPMPHLDRKELKQIATWLKSLEEAK